MDPTKIFREYDGRVFDIHLKDKRVEKTQGDDVSFDTHIGEGQGNIAELLAELLVAHRAPRHADDGESRRQTLTARQAVQRGQQLAARQVARRAEDHQRRRAGRRFDAEGVEERIPGRHHGSDDTGRG